MMCWLYTLCSEALTVHMTSLECTADDDLASADELESTAGDLDEPTDTETESIPDGMHVLLCIVMYCCTVN